MTTDQGTADLLVPASYRPDQPMPLLIALHGAGGRPGQAMALVEAEAERLGFLALAPKSADTSWDLIAGAFGADRDFLDRTLDALFDGFAVDPARIGVAGFSDGASYALSLGLTNGDLFADVLAFAPGFAVSAEPQGRPRIFIAHGRADPVLPVARCGRPLAARLTGAGYDVLYREFAGGHEVPPELAAPAIRRFVDGRRRSRENRLP